MVQRRQPLRPAARPARLGRPVLSGRPPAFPPDVAQALQRPAGSVSVRYTMPASLVPRPRIHAVLMETPYEDVLAALTLDTKCNLRFVRTGSRAEGARVALVNVEELVAAGAHWDIALEWDEEHLAVSVRDKDAPAGRALAGRWPRG